MHFRTYQDLSEAIISSLPDIPSDVDLVVGIPRSGLMAASLYALFLNLPLTTVDLLLEGRMLSYGSTKPTGYWINSVQEARKILFVEDSVNSGKSILECKKRIESSAFADKASYLCVYAVPSAIDLVDYCVEVVPQPRMFEWNFLTHASLTACCFDIDGVICPDPSPEQNDDAEEYISFIKNAPTKLKPLNKVGYIVTSRLEKYRTATEQWLEDNEISYGKLFMHNAPSAEVRRQLGNHAEFKASVYKKLHDAELFIESDDSQAQTIFRLTGKPVFCTDSQVLYCNEARELAKSRKLDRRASIKKQAQALLPKKVCSILKKLYHHFRD